MDGQERQTAFNSALDAYRGKYPARTDQTWADNAQLLYDFIVEHGHLPRTGDEPPHLHVWVRTQRRRVGSAAGIENESRARKRQERDAARVHVLNSIPGWRWENDDCSPECWRRLAQLRAFTRAHHRLPDSSRSARRRDSTESSLARWLYRVTTELREAAKNEVASSSAVVGSARWKLGLLRRFSNGLTDTFLD